MAPFLYDTDDRHQARFLMTHDVAMKHPVAGVVGNEGNPHFFTRLNQHRIAPRLMWHGGFVAAEDLKAVAMQVHWMPPRGLVT